VINIIKRNLFEPVSGNIIRHNAKLKKYPDGNSLTVANRPIFLEAGYEQRRDKPRARGDPEPEPAEKQSEDNNKDGEPVEKESKPKNMNNDPRPDSIRRAKQAVMDIVRLNADKWTHFITWTLDPEKIARDDKKEVSQELQTFLKNMVQRKNSMHVIIPEYHADGKNLHLHGLIAGDYRMLDSGKKTKDGKTIYNMPDWDKGFSTAIPLDGNIIRISRYITKYISKDFRKIFGRFYYYGGKGLIRKPPATLYDLDFGKIEAKIYTPNEFVSFKYKDLATDSTEAFIKEHEYFCNIENEYNEHGIDNG